MRILLALTVFVIACGGPKTKKESALVDEGSGAPATCCCKTTPTTAEKEITPVYAMQNRMECSTAKGDCVDDVQCNASNQPTPPPANDQAPGPVTTDQPIQ